MSAKDAAGWVCRAEAGTVTEFFLGGPASSPVGLGYAGTKQVAFAFVAAPRGRSVVEPGGIEPPTSCMPCKRSPS
jgi:hypothetical protein